MLALSFPARNSAILLLFCWLRALSCQADASPLPSGPLSAMVLKRLQCQIERGIAPPSNVPNGVANSLFPSLADQNSCGPQRGQQAVEDPFLRRLSGEFCTDPDAFCSTLRNLSEEDRATRFVNSWCDRVIPSAGYGRITAEQLEGDSSFATVVARSWGCESPVETVLPGEGGKLLVRHQYTCNMSVMPFSCIRALARPDHQDPAFLTFTAHGGRVESHARNRCTFSWTTPLDQATTIQPPPRESGEPAADYLARVRSGGTAEAAESARASIETSRARSQRIFTSLPGRTASERFRSMVRSLIPPARSIELGNQFERAKRALLDAMGEPPSTQNRLGATQAARDKIKALQMIDYRIFLKSNPTPQEVQQMETLEQMCALEGSAIGDSNWANFTFPGNRPEEQTIERVLACPNDVLMAQLGNPRALLQAMLHEISHAIDPCNVRTLETGNRDLSDQDRDINAVSRVCQAANGGAPATPNADQEFASRVRAMGHCLHEHSDMGPARHGRPSGPQARASNVNQAYYEYEMEKERLRAAADQSANKAENHRLNTCIIDKLYRPPQGIHSQCNLAWDADAPYLRSNRADPDSRWEKKRALRNAIRNHQMDKAPEAFADAVAAQVLPAALEADPSPPPLADQTPQQRAMEALLSVGRMCTYESSPEDSHPHPAYRASIYASSEPMRRLAGCQPVAVPAAEPGEPQRFPSRACSLDPSSTGR